MQTIIHDNFKLSYSIQGNGTPAIVIGSATYYPRTFSTNLRSHLQFIFMDHRGFGTTNSTFDNNAFSLEKLIDDIEKLRQHLNLDKMVGETRLLEPTSSVGYLSSSV